MEEYGVQSTHDSLKSKLLEYIITAYFGKNDDLRELCIDEIKRKGVLWQEPYIEANAAYKSEEDGIKKSNDPNKITLEDIQKSGFDGLQIEIDKSGMIRRLLCFALNI